jgi:hypothetical protein
MLGSASKVSAVITTELEDFEDVSDWSASNQGPTNWGQATDWKTEGAYSVKLYKTTAGANIVGDYIYIEKSIDLTRIDNLVFDAKLDGDNTHASNKAQLYVSGGLVWENDFSTLQVLENVLVDVSSYGGARVVRFSLHLGAVYGAAETQSFYIDALYGQSKDSYDVELRWEENNELAIENATLTAYIAGYGTMENNIVDGVIENVEYPNRPAWIKITHGDYYRQLVPSADSGDLTFYVVGAANQSDVGTYIFTLIDMTGEYGWPDGWLSIKKWVGDNLVTINEAEWSTDFTSSAYLILDHTYCFHVKNPTSTFDAGSLTMTADATRELYAWDVTIEGVTWWHEFVWWGAEWSDNFNEIEVAYLDNLENTTQIDIYIYDLTDNLLYQTQFTDDYDVSLSWENAENDTDYKVNLVAQHENFGELDDWRWVFALAENVEPPPVEPPPTGSPIPLPTIAGIILIACVGMSFSVVHASTASVIITFAAVGIKFAGVKIGLELLPIPWAALALFVLLAVIWKVGENI